MGDNTGIEWTDATWNPSTGCDKVSPGCDHCYAMTLAPRLKAMGSTRYQTDGNPTTSGPGFGFAMHPGALDQPLRWTRPRRIFVNSMSDLFHSDMSEAFLARVFAVMGLAGQHTFQVLTKRPGRMRSILSSPAFRVRVLDAAYLMAVGEDPDVKVPKVVASNYLERVTVAVGLRHDDVTLNALDWPLPNVWLGTSVEDQKRADVRIPSLLETPAAVRFLSCEPLLGAVHLDQGRCDTHDRDEVGLATDGFEICLPCAGDGSSGELSYGHWLDPLNGGIDWVIVGGESGRNARPMHPGWVRGLRDQCVSAGVAFLFKQWGEWAPGHRNVRVSSKRWQYESHRFAPDGTLYRGDQPDLYSYPGMESLLRVGKKAAGRVLDGRTWDEYPEKVNA